MVKTYGGFKNMTLDKNTSNPNLRFSKRRKELELSVAKVSKIVGVSTATISRWENGITDDIPFSKVAKYAEALQVSPLWILDPDEFKTTGDFFKDLYNLSNNYWDFNLKRLHSDSESAQKMSAINTLLIMLPELDVESLKEIVSFVDYKFTRAFREQRHKVKNPRAIVAQIKADKLTRDIE